jgi:hypothetical protein
MPAMSAQFVQLTLIPTYEIGGRCLLKWFDDKKAKCLVNPACAKREIAALPLPTLAFVAGPPQYRRITTRFHIRLAKLARAPKIRRTNLMTVISRAPV